MSGYDGDLSLPLGLALGSPIFPSGCEGSKRLPHWASLELSPSVERCGCGLGSSPVLQPATTHWTVQLKKGQGTWPTVACSGSSRCSSEVCTQAAVEIPSGPKELRGTRVLGQEAELSIFQ